jgi:hypothetical protein
MIRNFTFALLGVLVGLGLFTYGISGKKKSAAVAPATETTSTTTASQRVDEIQRNVIIDPVEIRNPTEAVAANTQTTTTLPQATTVQPAAAQSTTGATTLANEIIPVPPTPEPELDEGWANAAFIPKDAYDTGDSALESEIVE